MQPTYNRKNKIHDTIYQRRFALRLLHYFFRLVILVFLCNTGYSQNKTYNQFWNEFQFTRPLKGKWALEFNLGQTWTSTPVDKNFFHTNSQLYLRAWVHYYASPRWKLSFSYAYFYNKDVPEINQSRLPELRASYQAIYFIKKIGYTLSTRMRLEDRHILDSNNVYNASYRYRQQIKLVYPFNSKVIRKNSIYGFSSEEIYLKTSNNLTGSQFFDRNRFTIGAGYSFTDDFQLEVSYANEYLPRSGGNEIYNALQINVLFNNLFSNITKKIFHEPQKSDL
ncbi:DUF2490 domain-containing protein [Danxiaibacter flavus]|uniref:DUF2490 domain-containing protein n=1 Tax=Danxiaibacter flavus TaxID=3049108 RepID=A0ABV3ZCN5_9BACT|nr:DUF2490 domain-containing protein [Chitinophagaceae bacterium DXS]